MKVVEFDTFGYKNLKLNQKEKPSPLEGEVLVKIHSVSLNYRDYLTVEGKYNPKYRLPMIPCSDCSGEIVEIGKGVIDWKIGDRVVGVFAPDWISGSTSIKSIRNTLGGPQEGTLQEYRIFPKGGLVSMPSTLSYIEASTLPCAAVTAWSALTEFGKILPGEKIVTQGSGGVSLFAIQFAKILGAGVYAISGSDSKLEKLRELGADFVLNYNTNPNWGSEIKKITEGVDNVIEVGGSNTLTESIKALKPFGQISLIGILGGSISNLNLLPILMQNIRIQGILVGSKSSLESMIKAIDFHKIKPVIHKVYSIENFMDAFEDLKSGNQFGKICITLS